MARIVEVTAADGSTVIKPFAELQLGDVFIIHDHDSEKAAVIHITRGPYRAASQPYLNLESILQIDCELMELSHV